MMHLEGEIYGGLHIGSDENDTEVLLQTLEKCCSCNSHLNNRICHCDERGKLSVVDVLSTLKGPWAIIYWQVTPSGKFQLVLIRIWCNIFQFFFSEILL